MKLFLHSLLLTLVLGPIASAANVILPDNGSGTAQMPIQAAYPSINPMVITSGLPAGSQININAIWLARQFPPSNPAARSAERSRPAAGRLCNGPCRAPARLPRTTAY